MTDLRFIGRTDDGTQLELADSEGNQFFVRISDNLRAMVNQPRLVAVTADEDRISFSVKDIQARLRNGESPASIAATTDWSLEKIERFSGPIMQERAYVIGLALETPLRREGSSPSLMNATIAQLQPRGVDMQEVDWNTHRNKDGSWTIFLTFPTNNGSTTATWNFNQEARALIAEDDDARWISGEERNVRPSTPSHGMVSSPTPAPRLVAVSEETTTIRVNSAPDLTLVETEIQEGVESETLFEVEPEREIPADAKRDGVTKRIRIPSWDDIMFGGSKTESKEEPRDENN